MRDTSRLGPGEFPADASVEPYTDVVTGDITIFSPDLRVPSAETWQVGVQRALGQRMAVEARYRRLAIRRQLAHNNNYNELNIIENGFLDEFKLAQANLQANVAAGRGGTFAYMGPGTGTSPLPIFLAYFNGVGRDRAADAALYTSANFRSSTFLNPLARFNPEPLRGRRRARCRRRVAHARAERRVAAELHPRQSRPAGRRQHRREHDRDEVQLDGARVPAPFRLSGLHFQSSYVLGNATQTRFLSLRRDNPMVRNDGDEGDVTHAAKINLVYELPFGHGKRFGGNVNGFVDRVIGGWQVGVNAARAERPTGRPRQRAPGRHGR